MDKIGAHGRSATFNSSAIKRGQVSVRVTLPNAEAGKQQIRKQAQPTTFNAKHELEHYSSASELSGNDHKPRKKKKAAHATVLATRSLARKSDAGASRDVPVFNAVSEAVFEQKSFLALTEQPSSLPIMKRINGSRIREKPVAVGNVSPSSTRKNFSVPSSPVKPASGLQVGRLFASALQGIFQQNRGSQPMRSTMMQNATQVPVDSKPFIAEIVQPTAAVDDSDAAVYMFPEKVKIVFEPDADDDFFDTKEELPTYNDNAGGDYDRLKPSAAMEEDDEDAFYTADSLSPPSRALVPNALSPNKTIDFPDNDCGCGDASAHPYADEIDSVRHPHPGSSSIPDQKIERVHSLFDSARKNISKNKNRTMNQNADRVSATAAAVSPANAGPNKANKFLASPASTPKKQQQQQKPVTPQQRKLVFIADNRADADMPAEPSRLTTTAMLASPPKQQRQKLADHQNPAMLSPRQQKVLSQPAMQNERNAADAVSTTRASIATTISPAVSPSKPKVTESVGNTGAKPKQPVVINDKQQKLQMIFGQHRSLASSPTNKKSTVDAETSDKSVQTRPPIEFPAANVVTNDKQQLEAVLLDSNGRKPRKQTTPPSDTTSQAPAPPATNIEYDHGGRKPRNKNVFVNSNLRAGNGADTQHSAPSQHQQSRSLNQLLTEKCLSAAVMNSAARTAAEPNFMLSNRPDIESPDVAMSSPNNRLQSGMQTGADDLSSRDIFMVSPSSRNEVLPSHRQEERQPSPVENTSTLSTSTAMYYDSKGRKRQPNDKSSKAKFPFGPSSSLNTGPPLISTANENLSNVTEDKLVVIEKEQDTAPAPQYPDFISKQFKLPFATDSRGRRPPQSQQSQQSQQQPLWRQQPSPVAMPMVTSPSPDVLVPAAFVSLDVLIEKCKRQIAQLLQNSSFSKPAASVPMNIVRSFDSMRNAAHLHSSMHASSQLHMPFSDRRELNIYRMSERRYDLAPNSSISTFDATELNSWGVTSGLVDSHGHISMTFKKFSDNQIFTGFDKSFSFEKLRQNYAACYPSTYEGQIEVLCSVEHLVRSIEWQHVLDGANGQLALTIGLHPNWATHWSSNKYTAGGQSSLAATVIESLFALRRNVVAVGEAGLDFRKSNHLGGGGGYSKQLPALAVYEQKTKLVQKEVFMQQILLAYALNMPLVVHCRDGDGSVAPDEAYTTAFDMCSAVLPSYWPVHVHCYSGSLEVADKWLKQFSRAKIGFVPLRSFTNAELESIGQQYLNFQQQTSTSVDLVNLFNQFRCRELSTATRDARRINHEEWNRARLALFVPPERMLLETDAPFFIPKKVLPCDNELQQQGIALAGAFVKYTAQQMAALKCMPERDVIVAHRKNVRELYGI